MKQSELEWFRPLWLRVLVTGLVALWFGWETIVNQDQLWMIITGVALGYAVWNLFIKYPKEPAQGQAQEVAGAQPKDRPAQSPNDGPDKPGPDA